MSDDDHSPGELSLLIDDARPARGRRRGGGGRIRRLVGSVLAVVVISALVVGIFLGGRALFGVVSDVPDYVGAGSGSVQVRIDQGDSATAIATSLAAAGVVKSERAFRDAAAADADSLAIQPGLYELRLSMQATQALALLLDPASRVFDEITVPEGYTVARTLQALAEVTGRPLTEFTDAAAQTDVLGLPEYATGLEGFLFPSTYQFDPDDSALSILQSMVAEFATATAGLDLTSGAAALGLTPYQVIVVASMIESESRVADERPMIARVVYNRLGQGIPLGIDATSAYELGKSGTDLTTQDFQSTSPYNTRINAGLPPTPISNPGLASIEAALSPAAGPWIYYVLADADGHHVFTDDAAEFEAAKAACQAAGLGCG